MFFFGSFFRFTWKLVFFDLVFLEIFRNWSFLLVFFWVFFFLRVFFECVFGIFLKHRFFQMLGSTFFGCFFCVFIWVFFLKFSKLVFLFWCFFGCFYFWCFFIFNWCFFGCFFWCFWGVFFQR